ncbi:PEPxxWA-CTERM sorting domain-containing protein [Phenylobacterium sp. SCN 70-31]|uniref:PEPxxWA-CTERM sorting domain-containing protein n=1 Tax=Phenylobacterium sp. SCN 70-31 TaxID=1660129 RepID=UPI00086C2176|nr:PEPxxWA-CTERM sorting domain-containing protein [Phenylobacterium sp. SCN 70-31]ODT87434.1 MAG: hypothetical protein ABS78_11170 [Phenylobacterium sp. SCN 70-31]
MKSKVLASAVAAASLAAGAALVAAPAQAAVIYAFESGIFAFDYVSPGYVTGPLFVDLPGNASCVAFGVTCEAQFYPSEVASSASDTLSFRHVYPSGLSIKAFFYFPTGAFSTPGAYEDVLTEAGEVIVRATLTVSGQPDPGTNPGAIPEPATWALMIGGFGLAGSALRRRRAVEAV